jgi:hypothetical protein
MLNQKERDNPKNIGGDDDPKIGMMLSSGLRNLYLCLWIQTCLKLMILGVTRLQKVLV